MPQISRGRAKSGKLPKCSFRCKDSSLGIPADWISETELRAGVGVVDEDRSKFHRNLLNWRQHGLLLRRFDGREVPMVRHDGVGVGNEAMYPPITIELVRRINELRRRGRNIDIWLWQLWIDGLPIDIVDWCRTRLLAHLEILSDVDETLVIDAGTRKPAKRSDPRRSFYRRLKVKGWFALVTWAISVGIGARLPQSMFDPASSPGAALGKLFQSSVGPPSIRDRLIGSSVEDMRISRLLAILNEATATELENVRKDCCALARAGERRDIIGLVLVAVWRHMPTRAILLPGLIAIRRSPDHQVGLAAALGLRETTP